MQPPYTTGVNRSLAIAALAALGAAGDADEAQIEPLMDENVGAPCLNLAKLNLFQCLAVAKPHYEDVFCLGQHALMDTGECVSKTAGVVPANFTPTPEPKPVEEEKPSSHGRHGKHAAQPATARTPATARNIRRRAEPKRSALRADAEAAVPRRRPRSVFGL